MSRIDLTPEDPRTPEEIAAADPGIARAWGEEGAGREPAGPDPGLLDAEAPILDPLTEEEVATWLERVGRLLSGAWRIVGRWLSPVAVERVPWAWLFSDEELAEIPAPLTRVINRRFGWLRGVVRNADELELVFRLEEYVRVNVKIIREAEAAGPEGSPADEAAELPEGHPDRGPGGFGLEP